MTKPIKKCRKCAVEKPLDEFPKRASMPDGYRSTCKACKNERVRLKRLSNPEPYRARSNAWRRANPEKAKAMVAAWTKKHPERVRELHRNYQRAHPEYGRAWQKAHPGRTNEWVKNNPEKVRAAARRYYYANPEKEKARSDRWRANSKIKVIERARWRHAQRLRATPVWASKFILEEAYELAQLRTKATGIKWHVDHIVPLKSPIVCGLHCEANIQVIPAVDNIRKSNQVWPDMP